MFPLFHSKHPETLAGRLLDAATIAHTCLSENRSNSGVTLLVMPHPRVLDQSAGYLFSCSHYHEDSLGTALLLGSLSPRGFNLTSSAHHCACALLTLKNQGLISHATIFSSKGFSLEQLADDEHLVSVNASMSMVVSPEYFAALDHLRLDSSVRAIDLALLNDSPNFFNHNQRVRLRALLAAHAAAAQAWELSDMLDTHSHCTRSFAPPKTPPAFDPQLIKSHANHGDLT